MVHRALILFYFAMAAQIVQNTALQSLLPLPVVQTADRHMCDAGIMVTLHQPSETHNKTQTASLSSLRLNSMIYRVSLLSCSTWFLVFLTPEEK